jgi:hypothetical protein
MAALTVDQKLNAAIAASNLAIAKLESLLSKHQVHKDAAHVVLGQCEEYGVEATLNDIQRRPDRYGLKHELPAQELAAITAAVQKAHEMRSQVDLAMGEREQAFIDQDPGHAKRILFAGEKITVDKDGLLVREDGSKLKATLEPVLTGDAEHHQDRDR